MLNKVLLIGRLGRDVEFKEAAGIPVATFSLATDEIIKKNGQREAHTEWHRIVAFGQLAQRCAQYLKKGRLVYVEGKIRTTKYEDKNGNVRYFAEIYASTVRFLDGKRPDDSSQLEEEEIPF